MTRRAILSVAVGGWYPRGQQRLFDSLQDRGDDTTRLFWRDQYPPGSPTHTGTPYGFKPQAFAAARELGFDQAVWVDASCWMLRPLDPVWSAIDDDGYYFERDGHTVEHWISDDALRLLELTRDETVGMPLIEGKLIGLDLRDKTASMFLAQWAAQADKGAFNGPWTNDRGEASSDPRCRGHRHDIAVASPFVDAFGMRIQPQKRVVFPCNGEPGDQAVFFAQGM